jgi:FAD/FMN-containing dehydrogenase
MNASITTISSDLIRQLPGRVSMPGDEGYKAATAIWATRNGITPRAVVHCQTAGDVAAAIRASREHDLPLSVRGGGHDWAGRALCDGVVVDLSGMRDVFVDPDRRAAVISGGARVCDVTAVTDPLGVAVVAGSVGCVGLTGLTLGGGYGPLIGRFGLALDNVLEATVVLADGSIVCANSERHAELFWALRGGGGNFGVVTAMRYRLHELPSVHSGLLLYPFSEAKAVLESSAALAEAMPDSFSIQVGIAALPDGAPMVLVAPTWSGPPEEGERRLAPFLSLGTLLAGAIERKSYGALLSTFDQQISNGLPVFFETCWLPAFDACAIDTFIAMMRSAASPGCAILTHDFKGAASRVAADATAFGLRRDHIVVEILATVPAESDELDARRHRAWARNAREAFAGALPGGYPNFLGSDEAERAAKSYGGNAERLIRAKHRYDPDDVFSSAIPLPGARRISKGAGERDPALM